MLTVNLITVKLQSVDLVNELRNIRQLQITGESSITVRYTADNTHAAAELTATVKSAENPDSLHLRIVVAGTFAIKDLTAEEDKKSIHVLCYNDLFPYVQVYASQLLAGAGLPGFMLRKNNMQPENVMLANKPLN